MRQFPASLKARLGIGAALIGIVALLAAGLVVYALSAVSARLDAALAAERRLDRYAALSTQASTFMVVATEALQSGLDAEARAGRLESLSAGLTETFARIRGDLENAVREAESLGLNEQSRRATQSLGVARMEASFGATRKALLSPGLSRERLQGHIDSFAIGFDQPLNSVIAEEIRAREAILAGIGALKRRLVFAASGLAIATILLFAAFHLGLVRPQFRRLDLLRAAALRLGREDFAVRLPEAQGDEIGRLFADTNRAAAALADRKAAVDREWARLNETIRARTEELRAANARLSQTDEDRRRFFADISHELRTPLTVILAESELGEKGAGEPAQAFATIRSRAARLNRRIDDLLRIARSESGRLQLDAARFDLAEAMAAVEEETRPDLAAAGMIADFPETGSHFVTGDRNWTRQVIASLVRNATRHAREGGQVAVTIGPGTVRVIDNGAGIPAEAQSAVFDRFAQGPSPARAEGFGIGLALAKWVMEAQGGGIALESPVPEDHRIGRAPGTMVVLGLPVADG